MINNLFMGPQEGQVHCSPRSHTLSTTDQDKILPGSPLQTQAETIPQAWVHSGTVGRQPWGPAPWSPAAALSSCGHLAIGGTFLHCTEGEDGVCNVHSEALGLHPLMVPWASLVAEMTTGEPKVPSLAL